MVTASSKESIANLDYFCDGNDFNALAFALKGFARSSIHTAIPVRVDSVQPGGEGACAGSVSATPLVAQVDGSGNALGMVSIPKLPYFRYQCGSAAVILDPKVGDVGLAVFAQQDCSNITDKTGSPVVPGSHRHFDMSDGFYLGGFWGQKPETLVRLDPDSGLVHVKCKTMTVDADTKVLLNAPVIELAGALTNSKGSGSGAAAVLSQGATTPQDFKAAGISLNSHTHGGVQGGSSSTGGPK